VSPEEATSEIARHWLMMARDALDSATTEMAAGRYAYAVNRCYYAAFYAASAVLLKRGHKFVKHSGVRGAVHRDLVKTGLISEQWGRFYDELFAQRMKGDYVAFTTFERKTVESFVQRSRQLVEALRAVLP
jgi:uncharacterized protein (UPF0332 family)